MEYRLPKRALGQVSVRHPARFGGSRLRPVPVRESSAAPKDRSRPEPDRSGAARTTEDRGRDTGAGPKCFGDGDRPPGAGPRAMVGPREEDRGTGIHVARASEARRKGRPRDGGAIMPTGVVVMSQSGPASKSGRGHVGQQSSGVTACVRASSSDSSSRTYLRRVVASVPTTVTIPAPLVKLSHCICRVEEEKCN